MFLFEYSSYFHSFCFKPLRKLLLSVAHSTLSSNTEWHDVEFESCFKHLYSIYTPNFLSPCHTCPLSAWCPVISWRCPPLRGTSVPQRSELWEIGEIGPKSVCFWFTFVIWSFNLPNICCSKLFSFFLRISSPVSGMVNL